MSDAEVLRFWYSFLGLVVATLFLLAGLFLVRRGVHRGKGKAEARLGKARITFVDVAPWLALAILAVVVVFLTRMR